MIGEQEFAAAREHGDEILGRHFSVFYTDADRASGLPERVLKTARESSSGMLPTR